MKKYQSLGIPIDSWLVNLPPPNVPPPEISA